MEVSNLPDNLLLYIFSHLPVKERCTIGRVCRRWRRIANDKSLWRYVDLLPYKLDLKKTWKVVHSHLSECLLSIKLRGYMDGKGPNWNTTTMSNAMLTNLRDRCPNLAQLHLHLVYIDKIDASQLPKSLTSLLLTRCSWLSGWLKKAELPQLQCLSLEKTTRVGNTDIIDFVKFTNLEELSLHGCYRVKETAIISIAENLTCLTNLDISDTVCTDLCLHHIGRNLKRLAKLSIASCVQVTNGGLVSIVEGLRSLSYLDMSNCGSVTDSCLVSIFKIRTLKTLKHTLNTVNLNEEEMAKLKSMSQ